MYGRKFRLCADSYFGSVLNCVKLKKTLGIDSIMPVKTMTSLFPKSQLISMLVGKNVGSFAQLSAKIENVRVIATAWLIKEQHGKKVISFYISSCGHLLPALTPCQRIRWSGEDRNWRVYTLPRPWIVAKYQAHFNCIDIVNRIRQAGIKVESTVTEWRASDFMTGIGYVLVNAYSGYCWEVRKSSGGEAPSRAQFLRALSMALVEQSRSLSSPRRSLVSPI